MEYLRGQPLDQRIRSEGGSLFVAEAFRYMGELASGLHYAHSKKIIHRDIRPDNVMIDHGGTSRIFDFGIAYADDQLVQTTIGDIGLMGEYASPEQMLGRTLTPQSDLYSLGAVIYQALTGRKVIEAKSVEEILGQINAPVRPPSQLEEDVPPVLDTLLCKLLAKQPEHRYASAKDLLIDIGKLYATQDPGVRKALFGKVEDANLAWARRAYVQREYEKVHQLAQGCEQLSGPKKAAVFRLEALAYRAEGHPLRAIGAFQKAAEAQIHDINYTLDWVLEMVRQEQIPQAREALQREFRSTADKAVAEGLGNLLTNWKDPSMAAKRTEATTAAEAVATPETTSSPGLLGRLGSFFRGGKK
jgi:tetratricopeptide (TPR) repeat protein